STIPETREQSRELSCLVDSERQVPRKFFRPTDDVQPRHELDLRHRIDGYFRAEFPPASEVGHELERVITGHTTRTRLLYLLGAGLSAVVLLGAGLLGAQDMRHPEPPPLPELGRQLE